jgi:hypothetical protein
MGDLTEEVRNKVLAAMNGVDFNSMTDQEKIEWYNTQIK